MKKLEEILYCWIIDANQETRKDKSVWMLTARTQVGLLKFKLWDYSVDNNSKFPQKNEILKVRIENIKEQEEENLKYKSITLKNKNFIKIDKEEIPEEFESIFEIDSASKEKIDAAIANLGKTSFWKDKKNHEFVIECLKYAGLDLFRECPAAVDRHHNYKGGLLVHTNEVFNNCKALLDANEYTESVDKDVLFASAWLHDIGKTVTYFIDDLGVAKKIPQEETVTHTVFSNSLIWGYYKKSNFENKEFIYQVMHCVASHHGRKDWDAVLEPKTIEAQILHAADNISSKLSANY